MVAHVIHRLFLAEDLVRRRRADEQRRHISGQRSARIDPNPHQIEAVLFALARLPDGGCILADEVGLGKTIEAGLVIAQLLAEGTRRILIVTPKALLGQWKQELFSLFGIHAREVTSNNEPTFAGDGVVIATRDFVGSERGSTLLRDSERFELCIIDEAHEIFAGIYRRYDKKGIARPDSSQAQIAARFSQVVRDTGAPVILLTATPIQNSLLELWGLVHYIDPTGTLLGDLGTFRQLFCPVDDRELAAGQEHELQRRLSTVLQRTLRRQAQEFMLVPFMRRQAQLFDYWMSPQERLLYDDVTAYLLEPSLHAFRGNQRQLLLISFHRRMASSLRALSRSLENVAERLVRMRDATPDDIADRDAVSEDLQDAEDFATAEDLESTPADLKSVSAELVRVEAFIARARALPSDSKARALCKAVELVSQQAKQGKASGKLVIFTEYRATQGYLRELLMESGVLDGDITLFSGVNDSLRARDALARWQDEVGSKLSAEQRPSAEVAVRIALVHEFQTRSRILISTEAGAKGLNLQFCDTVVNYDLPWNPQRIEQRIGRCHRYAQQRDVTVINFLAADNEAQQLTYEILSQKLELFGTVLGATDEVLHRGSRSSSESLVSAVGVELETQLRKIYDRARTIEEISHELRQLRDAMEARKQEFEAAQQQTETVIRRHFDEKVRQIFRGIQDRLPGELSEFDRQVEGVVVSFLDAHEIPYVLERRAGTAVLTVHGSPHLPEALREGTACLIGDALPDSLLRSLHLGHPLVLSALEHIRATAMAGRFALRVTVEVSALRSLRGRRGRARVFRIVYRGGSSGFQVGGRIEI